MQRTMDIHDRLRASELERTVKSRIGSSIRELQLNYIEARGLILRGQAKSYFAKQTVQEVVMAMTAIPIVANDIRVTVDPMERSGW